MRKDAKPLDEYEETKSKDNSPPPRRENIPRREKSPPRVVPPSKTLRHTYQPNRVHRQNIRLSRDYHSSILFTDADLGEDDTKKKKKQNEFVDSLTLVNSLLRSKNFQDSLKLDESRDQAKILLLDIMRYQASKRTIKIISQNCSHHKIHPKTGKLAMHT